MMLPIGNEEAVGLVNSTDGVEEANESVISNTSLEAAVAAGDDEYSSYYYWWSFSYESEGRMLQEGIDTWVPIVLFVFVFLVGVPANAVVIFVLARNGICRSEINMYLLNLAVVDFIFLLFKVPLKLNTYIVSTRNMWHLGPAVCKLGVYVLYVNMTVSILTLVALAVNRYNAVMRPVSCRSNRGKTHAILTITAIWIVSLASQFPSVVVANTHNLMIVHRVPTTVCLESWSTYDTMRAFKGANFAFFYCIPLAVVSVCYIRMARTLQRSAGFTRGESGESALAAGLQRQQSSRRKVARMVHILVLAFALCMLLWHILMLISCTPSITMDDTVSFYFGIVARWAVYLNSCLNPLLYSFFSQNFKAKLRKSCACLRNVKCRKKIFTPIEVGFVEVADGLDENARSCGSSGQRSFTSVLTRAC